MILWIWIHSIIAVCDPGKLFLFSPEIKQTKIPIEFTGCQHKSSPPTARSNRSRQPGPAACCVTTRCQTQFNPNSFPPLLFSPPDATGRGVNLILTFSSVQAKQTNCRENELNARGRKKLPELGLLSQNNQAQDTVSFFMFRHSCVPIGEGLQAVRRKVQRLGPRKARDKSRTSNNHHASFGGLLFFANSPYFFSSLSGLLFTRHSSLVGRKNLPPISNYQPADRRLGHQENLMTVFCFVFFALSPFVFNSGLFSELVALWAGRRQ